MFPTCFSLWRSSEVDPVERGVLDISIDPLSESQLRWQ